MKIIRPETINDASLASSSVLENDYAAYNAGTTYNLADRVIVVSTNIHKVYESLQAANTGHTPASSPTWWLEVSSTNRWKMFDALVGSQTTNADSIGVNLIASGRVDSVALLNVSAASVRVTQTDPVDGVVYDSTESMIYGSGITDWYAWFFEPIVRKNAIVFLDLLPYNGATIGITLTDTGATVACGACIIGMSKEIGGTQYGAAIGIQDYSVKTADAFGSYTITERAFSKRGTFNVQVAAGYVDALQVLLETYRATPVVYIGSDLYAGTIIYGFYKDFSIAIDRRDYSSCSIEIEGLT